MSASPVGQLPAAIGPYRVLAELGKGGMAFVYLCVARKHPTFTKLLVVKILRGELATEGDFVAMFMNEARVAAQLSHPNVVQTYEVGEHEGRPFIAMEYLEGLALAKVISRAGPSGVPLGAHLRMLTDMLAGLHYAHELVGLKGEPLTLVHRDVSPHNVLVSYGGLSKVLDFGIAKIIDTTQTREGIVKGKIGYMAPEQLSGLPVDRRADIFASGVMLWEAIAGRKLVMRNDVEAGVVHRRISGGEPRLLEVCPDAPPQLVAVCERAMAARPEERFATAAEMHDAIEAYSKTRAPADTRDVAEFLERTFGEERSKLRKLVEERLRHDDGPAAAAQVSFPSLPPGPTSASSATAGAVVPPSVAPPRRRRRGATAFAAGLLLVGIAAFVYAVWAREPRRASTAFDVPSQLPAPAPSSVVVVITVTPANATLSVDGRPTTNPSELRLPRNGAPHRIVASADGYATDARTVILDSNDAVSIVLAPVGLAASASASVSAASSAPSPRVPLVGAPGLQELDPREPRKKRPIYTEDPYK
jgi:serine/threonine protein kinase